MPAFVLSQPKVTDGLSAPFILSPTSIILYESLMDVSLAMTLMSEQNNLTWFATELSKQAPHWSSQSRVTDGLSAPFFAVSNICYFVQIFDGRVLGYDIDV